MSDDINIKPEENNTNEAKESISPESAAKRESSNSQKLGWIFVIASVLIIAFIGLRVTGFSIGNSTSSVGSANIQGGVQEIKMAVDYSGYSPNSFVLKRGIPVKWIINVKALTGCNSKIISEELNLNIALKEGTNTITFTPDKAGTISFHCSMGMLRGNFIVTDDGTATKEQVAAAKPTAGSCGGGSGGGCGGGCGGGSGGGCGGCGGCGG